MSTGEIIVSATFSMFGQLLQMWMEMAKMNGITEDELDQMYTSVKGDFYINKPENLPDPEEEGITNG
jgi:hypothetical protein